MTELRANKNDLFHSVTALHVDVSVAIFKQTSPQRIYDTVMCFQHTAYQQVQAVIIKMSQLGFR